MSNEIDTESAENKRAAGTTEWWLEDPTDKVQVEEDKIPDELKPLFDEVEQYAKIVVQEYKDLPSEMSGSIHQVHENSPVLQHEELKMKLKKE